MFEQKSVKEVMEELETSQKQGLSDKEAKKRLEIYGENKLAKTREKTIFEMFLEQLNDPLIFVLFVAAAVSMLLREFSDTVIILIVIFINAIVGVVQEGKARKALDALKKLTSPTALVRREGRQTEIAAADLVPGDLVCLEAGRQIPADLRLVETASMKVEEAALTGESVPVEKEAGYVVGKRTAIGDRKNMAYMSTNVIYGRGEGIVIATGMSTEIGKIAGMIDAVPNESTPLQKRLGDLGKLLSILAVFLCIALFGIAVLQKRNIFEMLLTAISLAVAAVPEGLPAVVTIVLALSVSRMVKVNTIVRRLPCVETLGAVNIVCSDKTGTLTQNKMTVTYCYIDQRIIEAGSLDKKKDEHFLNGFLLCNDASIKNGERIGDPTELALLDMGWKLGVEKEDLEKMMPRIKEKPFDSDRKMMSTLHRRKSSSYLYTKGAADRILNQCSRIRINGKVQTMTERDRRKIKKAMEEMAMKALRVLALAMKEGEASVNEKDLTFVGMVGMIDPVREEAARAVKIFERASVKTVMITGDHIDTAFAIAKELGIAEDIFQCMSGEELEHMSENEIKRRIESIAVFARVSPEHKVKIVKALKARGNIVAMTGDGVNDAPSLRAADIGIAMGQTGTDVAKNASDIILTDDNFATIEKAIEEGRGIYENIKKSVIFLLSSNFGEIITMFLSIIAGLASPLKASHILWINLITDSLPALALGVDKNDGELLMNKPPRNSKESLFAHGGLFCTLFYGAVISFISLAAFLTIPYGVLAESHLAFNVENILGVLAVPGNLARSQTYAFTVLGLSQLFHAIGMRNVEQSVFKMNHLENKLMIGAFVVGMSLQVLVTEVPYFVSAFGTVRLSLGEWFRLIALSSIPMWAHELLLFHPFAGMKRSMGAVIETEDEM